MIFAAMLILGCLLGCVGAGGAGLTITMLAVGFGISIHTALAVALSAMCFTMLSGTVSHYREGDVLLRIGIPTSLAGMCGAFLGVRISNALPDGILANLTGSLLLFSTLLLYLILFHRELINRFVAKYGSEKHGAAFYVRTTCLGCVTGFMSGAFGIGSTAFIQIGLMLLFGISLYHAIGTTMLIILPISVAGGLGYLISGHLDLVIFLQTLSGLALGAYIGAKFTRLLPPKILNVLILAMPSIGGLLLIFKR